MPKDLIKLYKPRKNDPKATPPAAQIQVLDGQPVAERLGSVEDLIKKVEASIPQSIKDAIEKELSEIRTMLKKPPTTYTHEVTDHFPNGRIKSFVSRPARVN